MGKMGWASVGCGILTLGRQRLGFDHQPHVLIFVLYRCKVNLTTVLNSGFFDEVGMELGPVVLPDLDQCLILIVPLSLHQVLFDPAYFHSG